MWKGTLHGQHCDTNDKAVHPSSGLSRAMTAACQVIPVFLPVDMSK